MRPEPSFAQIKAQARSRQQHAAGCKKALDDCASCQDSIRWFGELPLDTLSRVLEETPNEKNRTAS